MRANKYQRLALKTALLDRSMEDQLLNSILGLCGESGELCEIIKNGGDSLTARYIELMVQVGELGDTIKKNIFHGHPVDKVKEPARHAVPGRAQRPRVCAELWPADRSAGAVRAARAGDRGCEGPTFHVALVDDQNIVWITNSQYMRSE